MGEDGRSGMRHGVFVAWLGAIVGIAVLQSVVHLEVVLGHGHVGSIVDLDRSNSLPDVLSTVALAAAAAAAIRLAGFEVGRRRAVPTALACALVFLTFADLVHDGPHPASDVGWLVIVLAVATGALLVGVALRSGARARVTFAIAGCLLAASFCVNALDQLDARRFERERGDPIAEYQIVTKEGLELLGWSLVAVALWDEALRRRGAARVDAAKGRAPRGLAAARRRAV